MEVDLRVQIIVELAEWEQEAIIAIAERKNTTISRTLARFLTEGLEREHI